MYLVCQITVTSALQGIGYGADGGRCGANGAQLADPFDAQQVVFAWNVLIHVSVKFTCMMSARGAV